MDTRAFIAEFIGTFTLVFVGAFSVAVTSEPMTGVLVPAFAHGLIVLGLIYTFGHLSGAHFNPAVTVGLLIGKHITPTKAAIYITIQLFAGIVAGYALAFIVAPVIDVATFNYGETTGLLTADYVWHAAILEVILTFMLVSTIYQAAVYGKAGNLAGVAIGMTLTALILAGGIYSGASLNPARTLGPAMAGSNLSYFIPYLIGTVGGGALAGALHTVVLPADPISDQEPDYPVTENQQR